MFDALRGRGDGRAFPTMGCTHGYSWFDPFRIIKLNYRLMLAQCILFADHEVVKL